MNLYPLFKENIQNNQLILPGEQIIVAFSGGKDSTMLLLLLKELQQEIAFTLQAAYFNHRLRNDSNQEEEWVKTFCHQQKIELFIGQRDVRQYSQHYRLNLEAAAAYSRYHFFNLLLQRFPKAKIATAHNRTDLAETFLIKLFRGSGLQGLSGIYQRKYLQIIRPLLLFSQEEILTALKEKGVAFYQDPSNQQPLFLRNRIRLELLPQIKKIEPQFEEQIFKTVEIIQQEFEFFAELSRKILKKNLLPGNVLKLSVFQNKHLALQRHLVREYIRLLKGNLLNIGFNHICEFLESMHQKSGLSLPGLNLTFARGYAFDQKLTIPDYCYVWQDLRQPLFIPEISTRFYATAVDSFQKPANNKTIIVPLSKLKFPLIVRNYHRQDRFQKFNTSFAQKVSEVIRAIGFPEKLKSLVPLLVNADGEIIWVSGAPVGEHFRVEPEKKEPLIIFLIKREED